jgi:beta-galactosidase
VHIEISLEDLDGNLVMTADHELTVKVSGAGELLVLENGNSLDHTIGRCENRKAHYGLLLAVVRSLRDQQGVIQIEVSGEGLKTQKVEIIAESVS